VPSSLFGRRKVFVSIVLVASVATAGCTSEAANPISSAVSQSNADSQLSSNSGSGDTTTTVPDSTATETTAQVTQQSETSDDVTPRERVNRLVAEIVATYPHDEDAFTQGLEFLDDTLVESTGLRGRSTLRYVDPVSGKVLQSISLNNSLFGEGTTVTDGEIWQLTWQSQTAIVYSASDLQELRRYTYEGEGWGLCAMGGTFVMSDGSDQLTFRSQDDFSVVGTVAVTFDGIPVPSINELECVGDSVWANIYQTSNIISIDSVTGKVTAIVDASPLVPQDLVDDSDSVLNGIAYDASTGNFWLTGKRWPAMYEVSLVEGS